MVLGEVDVAEALGALGELVREYVQAVDSSNSFFKAADVVEKCAASRWFLILIGHAELEKTRRRRLSY